ncbi:MAG: hypothetical protein LBM69_09750 [Lachnospiraceae bacterium]|nr:hypothetical protein [Lachnospiraceae bacterium]
MLSQYTVIFDRFSGHFISSLKAIFAFKQYAVIFDRFSGHLISSMKAIFAFIQYALRLAYELGKDK